MNLSKKEKILIMLLVVVMVGGGFYMYIYSPKDKELAANKEYFKTADKDLKEAESTYNLVSGVGGINVINKQITEQTKIRDSYLTTGGQASDGKNLFWTETDYPTNYRTLDYLRNTYLPELGISLNEGCNVSITVFQDNQTGVTKYAMYTVSDYVCYNGMSRLEEFVDAVDAEMSLTLVNISVASVEGDEVALTGSLTLRVEIATRS